MATSGLSSSSRAQSLATLLSQAQAERGLLVQSLEGVLAQYSALKSAYEKLQADHADVVAKYNEIVVLGSPKQVHTAAKDDLGDAPPRMGTLDDESGGAPDAPPEDPQVVALKAQVEALKEALDVAQRDKIQTIRLFQEQRDALLAEKSVLASKIEEAEHMVLAAHIQEQQSAAERTALVHYVSSLERSVQELKSAADSGPLQAVNEQLTASLRDAESELAAVKDANAELQQRLEWLEDNQEPNQLLAPSEAVAALQAAEQEIAVLKRKLGERETVSRYIAETRALKAQEDMRLVTFGLWSVCNQLGIDTVSMHQLSVYGSPSSSGRATDLFHGEDGGEMAKQLLKTLERSVSRLSLAQAVSTPTARPTVLPPPPPPSPPAPHRSGSPVMLNGRDLDRMKSPRSPSFRRHSSSSGSLSPVSASLLPVIKPPKLGDPEQVRDLAANLAHQVTQNVLRRLHHPQATVA